MLIKSFQSAYSARFPALPASANIVAARPMPVELACPFGQVAGNPLALSPGIFWLTVSPICGNAVTACVV